MPIYVTSNSTGPGVRFNLGATANQSIVVAQGVVVGATDNNSAIAGAGAGQSAFIHGFTGAQNAAVIRLDGANAYVGVGSTGVVEGLETHSDSISYAAIYLDSSGTVSNYGMIRGDWALGIDETATISNGGVIEGYSAQAIHVSADASIVNTGDIIGAGTFASSTAINVVGGFLKLTNSGAIQATKTAIRFDGAATSQFDAYNNGLITGGEGDAIFLASGGDVNFTNDGRVVSGVVAFRVNYLTDAVIKNTGEMRGVTQSVRTADGDDSLMNRGSLWGGVTLLGGVDVLDNRGGLIEGDVDLGDGVDSFDNLGGVVNGTVFGGAGNDTFRLGAGIEFIDGGADIDAIDFRGTPAVEVSLDGSVEGTGNAAGDDYTGVENIYGSYYADLLVGSSGANTLRGYGGNDVMNGGLGADKMVGGNGVDTMTGGNGSDVFVYDKLSEIGDLITDFNGASDLFNIRASAFDGGLVAGTLGATLFQSRADNLAQDGDDRFIFRTTDRTLWFDVDGNGAGAAVMVADLQAGASVSASNIVII